MSKGSFWHRALEFADLSGKLATLVGIPSAVLAVVVFWQEILDTVTTPEISAQLQTVELRCAVALGTREEQKQARASFGSFCGPAPLAVSFEITLTNEDSIARTIENLYVDLHASFLPGPLTYPAFHIVEHGIQNYVESTRLVSWREQHIPKGQSRRFEVQFQPLLVDLEVPFATLRDQLRDDKLTGESIGVGVRAAVTGARAPIDLLSCSMVFESASVERFKAKGINDQVAYVRRCTPL